MPNEHRHAFLSFMAAGAIGPLFADWLVRALVCALIGLVFNLLADWLRPAVARHGRHLAGGPVTNKPPPLVPPSADRTQRNATVTVEPEPDDE